MIAKLLFVLFSIQIHAATFIGNGGQSQDVELDLTMEITRETLARLKNAYTEDLCRCHSREGLLCDRLKKLKPAMLQQCRSELKELAPQMLQRLLDPTLRVHYVDGPIVQELPSGEKRTVDAITHEMKIAFDRQVFGELSVSERVALLVHEILHTLPVGGSLRNDEDEIEGFGTYRAYFDVLGASAAVYANEADVMGDYQYSILYSRDGKRFHLGIARTDVIPYMRKWKNLPKTADGVDLFATMRFDDYAARIGVEGSEAESSRNFGASQLDVSETRLLGYVEGQYFLRPFSFTRGYFSQVVVVGGLQLMAGNATLLVEDGYQDTSDSATMLAAGLRFEIKVPLLYNFWLNLAYLPRYTHYKYDTFNIDREGFENITSSGVSYAF